MNHRSGDLGILNLSSPQTPSTRPNVRHIRSLLKASGQQCEEYEAYLLVNEFFEWFQDNIFNYHSSQIGEYLNNIH